MTTTASSNKSSSNLWFIGIVVAIFVAGAALVAILATSRERGLDAEATAPIDIDGDPLGPMPPGITFTSEELEPSLGWTAPTLTGTNFDGEEFTIEPDGRPKAVYFLAHWCPHCQAEVPVIQELIDEGSVPEGLDLYAVSTSYDVTRGSHPALWLENEGFTVPTMRDDPANNGLRAFGAGGFPFVVYLDSNHQVIMRTSGSLDKARILSLWEQTAQS